MNKPVRFRNIAAFELEEARDWYEERHAGLGREFLTCVAAVVGAVSRHPQAASVVYKDVRRAITRRFPYAVFYIDEPDAVLVLAIFHVSRDPQVWKNRA